MKDGFFGHVLVAVVLLGGLWYGVARYQDSIVEYIEEDKEQTLLIGNTQLRVRVADEPSERSQGLSGVTSLAANEGMLFIFDREDNWSMWMKDMEIPIDMLWVNSDYHVIHIEENVTPETFPEAFSSGEPARFVIETPAFFTKNNNIVVGDIVYIPETIQPVDVREPLY